MVKGSLPSLLLSATTLTLLATFFTSSVRSPDLLSPQGCRMSYMSPSYILQPDFNSTWTKLARRYSLWLYREVGWESHENLNGVPVLFLPGNAGSSRQVRSIASSATRQYYAEPYNPNWEFVAAGAKPLDFFAVDFNEDFSALHGPTLLSERSYTSATIKYILSLYPPHTQIILMGHSMGGIVALSLLPSPDISAVITMSTPHALPPARLDMRIEAIYSDSWNALKNDSTPVLSICGGATDLMVPSETCSMEHSGATVGWRKTVFTTCMEGTWSGVGHREMVWCHQVRWRVARAALELGNGRSNDEKGAVLDRWFRDEVDKRLLIQNGPSFSDNPAISHIPVGRRLILRDVPRQSSLYFLPLPSGSTPSKFVLYVARGTVTSLSPHHTSDLQVSVYRCRSSYETCRPVQPRSLKLIPNPSRGIRFPVSGEGVDESDGVVVFEATLDPRGTEDNNADQFIGVAVRGGGDQRSWVLGGFEQDYVIQSDASKLAPLWSKVSISLDPTALTTSIRVPNVLSHSLIVYRIEPLTAIGSCADALLPPLLLHWSGPSESHFHPTDGTRPILIHTHSSGPFIRVKSEDRHGVNLYLYSSGECGVSQLELTIDWWSSIGSWGLRYWTTLCAWACGVIGVMMVQAWDAWEKGATLAPVPDSLAHYISRTMVPLSGILLLLSCLPLNASYLLGNSGEVVLSPLSPLLLFMASGCVAISWHLLQGIMWVLSKVASGRRITEEPRGWRRYLWSYSIILILVATVVPTQVAFLVCFLIHLLACAVQAPATHKTQVEAYSYKTHVLLLLFWLLPIVAPVLVVWVRTLATAGLTTPFDGDHGIPSVISFLLMVDFAPGYGIEVFVRTKSRVLRNVTSVVFYGLAVISFIFGGRYTYRVYQTSNLVVSYLVVTQVVPGMWTSSR